MSTLSSFPLELVERVLDHIHDDTAALLSSTLVHRSWTACCQYHLFHTVALVRRVGVAMDTGGPTRILSPSNLWSRLVELLQGAPHLRPLVREVVVIALPLPENLGLAPSAIGELFPCVSALHARWIPLNVSLIGAVFPALRILDIRGAPRWQELEGVKSFSAPLSHLSLQQSEGARDSLLSWLSHSGVSKSLIQISLEYPCSWTLSARPSVSHFLALTSVQCLTLRASIPNEPFESMQQLCDFSLGILPHLGSLRIIVNALPPVFLLVHRMLSTSQLPELHELEIDVRGATKKRPFVPILHADDQQSLTLPPSLARGLHKARLFFTGVGKVVENGRLQDFFGEAISVLQISRSQ